MATTVKETDLTAGLAALQGDYAHLGARLKHVVHTVTCPLSGVELRLNHPSFRDGKPTVHDLALAASHFLIHFALPRHQRARVSKLYGKVPHNKYDLELSLLRQKAKDTFIKAHKATKRTGEAGELLLFLLTEWQLGAPQILAKLGLKTNPIMPVYGSDGVHVRYDDASKSLVFYLGESKIHADLKKALTSAAKSIADSLKPQKMKYEIDLVERYISVSGLSEEGQEALIKHLHPFEDCSNQVSTVITALICYNYSDYNKLEEKDPNKREAEFQSKSVVDLAASAQEVAASLSAAGLNNQKVELFLVPVPSVEEFRTSFQNEIGWVP